MNSHYNPISDNLRRISILPKPETYTATIRHPIFFWHIKHVRTVTVESFISDSRLCDVKYSDKQRNIVFVDRNVAEHYLHRKILVPACVGKLYIQQPKKIYMYYICVKCGYIECVESDAILQGPLDAFRDTITTITELPCPKCKKTLSVEICTVPSLNQPSDDCDWK